MSETITDKNIWDKFKKNLEDEITFLYKNIEEDSERRIFGTHEMIWERNTKIGILKSVLDEMGRFESLKQRLPENQVNLRVSEALLSTNATLSTLEFKCPFYSNNYSDKEKKIISDILFNRIKFRLIVDPFDTE